MEKSSKVILGLVAAVAGLGALAYAIPGKGEPLLDACEEALKERLKAPSTYHRVSASTSTPRAVTGDEYLSWERQEDSALYRQPSVDELKIRIAQAKDIDEKRDIASISTALITYEASNSFGVPIRSRVVCEDMGLGERRPSAFSVRIDGMTNLMLMVDQARNAKQ